MGSSGLNSQNTDYSRNPAGISCMRRSFTIEWNTVVGNRQGSGVVGDRSGSGVVGYRRGIGVVGDHDFYGDVSQRREIALIAHRIFLLNPVSQIGRYLMLTGCIIYF